MNITRISTEHKKYSLGKINNLKILRIVSIGAYLEWDNEEGILLPIRYFPHPLEEGSSIEVFVYHDNEGRLIATTLIPNALVGEVAHLECVSITESGAFLNWGIHKDLFVPFVEQLNKLQVGKKYLTYLYIDHISGKIVGSTKLNKHIGNNLPTYKSGSEVKITIYETNDVGYRGVVDNQHWGIIYFNQNQSELAVGKSYQAYVIRVREDGKVDLSLRPIGYLRTEEDTDLLIRLLQKRGGSLPIGDKSPATHILSLTGLSKKSFKMAVGRLYKERRITISPTSIHLI